MCGKVSPLSQLVLRRLAMKRQAARKGAPKEQRRKVVGCTFHHLNWRPSLAPSRPRICRPQPVCSPHRAPRILFICRLPSTGMRAHRTLQTLPTRHPRVNSVCGNQSRPAGSLRVGRTRLLFFFSSSAGWTCTVAAATGKMTPPIHVAELRGKIQVTADCWTGHASVTKPLLRPLRIVECLQAPWASKEEEHQDQFCLGGQCCKRTPVSFAFPVPIHVFNFFIPPPTIRFSYSCRLLSASPNSSADGCLKVFAADVSRAVY